MNRDQFIQNGLNRTAMQGAGVKLTAPNRSGFPSFPTMNTRSTSFSGSMNPSSQTNGGFDTFYNNTTNGRNALNTNINNQENTLNKSFQDFVNGQEGYYAMSNRIGNELGLPNLQKNANQLQQTVANIPKVQTQATQNFDVNDNQLQRMIASQQYKLSPLAQQAQTQAGLAQDQVNQRLNLGQADNQRLTQPFQYQYQTLQDRANRELQGFNTDTGIGANYYGNLGQTQFNTNEDIRKARDINQMEVDARQKLFDSLGLGNPSLNGRDAFIQKGLQQSVTNPTLSRSAVPNYFIPRS